MDKKLKVVPYLLRIKQRGVRSVLLRVILYKSR
jgi:hypothetical protein